MLHAVCKCPRLSGHLQCTALIVTASLSACAYSYSVPIVCQPCGVIVNPPLSVRADMHYLSLSTRMAIFWASADAGLISRVRGYAWRVTHDIGTKLASNRGIINALRTGFVRRRRSVSDTTEWWDWIQSRDWAYIIRRHIDGESTIPTLEDSIPRRSSGGPRDLEYNSYPATEDAVEPVRAAADFNQAPRHRENPAARLALRWRRISQLCLGTLQPTGCPICSREPRWPSLRAAHPEC